MNYITSKIVCFALVLMHFSFVNAQVQKFNILQNGTIIGSATFTTVKDTTTHTINYHLYTEYKTNIGIELSIIDETRVNFVNDTLQQAIILNKLNGKERVNITQIYQPDSKSYKRTAAKQLVILNTPYTDSFIELYAKAPLANTKTIFSELYGKMLDIKKIAENTYQVTNGVSFNNTYHYDNKGKLVKVIMKTNVGTFEMIAVS